MALRYFKYRKSMALRRLLLIISHGAIEVPKKQKTPGPAHAPQKSARPPLPTRNHKRARQRRMHGQSREARQPVGASLLLHRAARASCPRRPLPDLPAPGPHPSHGKAHTRLVAPHASGAIGPDPSESARCSAVVSPCPRGSSPSVIIMPMRRQRRRQCRRQCRPQRRLDATTTTWPQR